MSSIYSRLRNRKSFEKKRDCLLRWMTDRANEHGEYSWSQDHLIGLYLYNDIHGVQMPTKDEWMKKNPSIEEIKVVLGSLVDTKDVRREYVGQHNVPKYFVIGKSMSEVFASRTEAMRFWAQISLSIALLAVTAFQAYVAWESTKNAETPEERAFYELVHVIQRALDTPPK